MWDTLDDRDSDALGRGATDGGKHCTVQTRYVPMASKHARQRLQEQVYYAQCRDRHDEEDETRELFDSEKAGISRADARSLLWDSRGTNACFHRLILSPSKGLGIKTPAEMQEWVRTMMADLAERSGLQLTYCAAVHANTRHIHAHVLLAGAGITAAGKRQGVRISKGDLAALRESGVRASRPIRAARTAARAAALDDQLGLTRKAG